MKNVLIIGAHYDDAELGAGGTAAFLVSKGCNVYKLTLTNNVTNFLQRKIKVEYDSSLESSKKACDVLGVKEIAEFKPIECNSLVYDTKIMQQIEDIIYKYNIDTVFIHYNHDINQDHNAASRLSLTAARHCDNVLFYQSNGYVLDVQFTPTIFFDISKFVDKKKLALEQYGNEHNRFNRLFEINLKRNELWGYGNKCEYAEGFMPVKWLEK